jgi:hypothetical protein
LMGNCLAEAGFRIDSIRIYTHAWPPMFDLWNRVFPPWFFDVLCRITAVVYSRRQIIAVATNEGIAAFDPH